MWLVKATADKERLIVLFGLGQLQVLNAVVSDFLGRNCELHVLVVHFAHLISENAGILVHLSLAVGWVGRWERGRAVVRVIVRLILKIRVVWGPGLLQSNMSVHGFAH